MVFNNIVNTVQGFLPVLPGTLFGLGGQASGSSSQAAIQAKHAQEKTLQEQTELALKSAPTKEAYIQILAQKASYCNFKDKHPLTKSDHFTCPAYQVKKTISYPNGIKALVVISDVATESPMIVFRGTDTSNTSNVIDDLNVNIGEINCKAYAKELREEIEQLHKKHGRIHLTGHSYGGTVAERLAAEYPALICRCTTHNSPAAGKRVIKKFKKNVAKLPKGLSIPEIVKYRHAKDLPSLLGGKHLPATPGKSYTMGSVKDKISYLAAHSLNALSTGEKVAVDASAEKSLKKMAKKIEYLRKGSSALVPLFQFVNQVIKKMQK
jgi:hypothetical protein